MLEFNIAAFIADLDHMGMKLTVVPLANGKSRVNRWRLPKAVEHAKQIDDLWAAQIGDNQERHDQLAVYIASAAQPASNKLDGPFISNRIAASAHPVVNLRDHIGSEGARQTSAARRSRREPGLFP